MVLKTELSETPDEFEINEYLFGKKLIQFPSSKPQSCV